MTEASSYYLCAAIAVIVSGLAKGGFSGLGALAMPVFALAVDPVRGAAILLPILIAQDCVSVWQYRNTRDGGVLRVMLPGMAVGVILGFALAATVDARIVLAVLGCISVLFGTYRLWMKHHRAVDRPSILPDWTGTLFGVVSGFASQIAHAGAPPFQMWVLPRHLPRDVLVGTTAIAFAAMNWMKVPAYVALGQITLENLSATAVLMPLAVVSTLAGVAIVRRVDPQRFYTLIYVLMVLVGLKLLADAFG